MKAGENGFTLIEAVVATGLVSMGIGGMIAALLFVMRPISDATESALLSTVVENVLTDLRASSVYDVSALAGVAGPGGASRTFTVIEPAVQSTPVPIQVTVTYEPHVNATGPVYVDVYAKDQMGHALAVTQRLVTEAPAPGTVFDASPSNNEFQAPAFQQPGTGHPAPAATHMPFDPCAGRSVRFHCF